MNWDQVQGQWKQYTGRIQEKWGQLTENEVQEAAGDREQIEGLIQERYGKTKDEARQDVDQWLSQES